MGKTELNAISTFLKGAACAALAFAGMPSLAQDTLAPSANTANWGELVVENEGGHLVGNPDAEAQLIEFMRYTCSHCAEFARTGEGAIKLLYVPTGKVSLEVRHLIRDPIDLTAALLTQCGGPDDFFANHEAIILDFDKWMAKARVATQAQQARWRFGSIGSRAQAIASDLDFYEIMEARGYDRPQIDRCLTDEAKARAIAEQSQADAATYGLRGTPTFILGGETLNVRTWETIQPLLDRLF